MRNLRILRGVCEFSSLWSLLSEERKAIFHDEDIENLRNCDYMLTVVQQDDNRMD